MISKFDAPKLNRAFILSSVVLALISTRLPDLGLIAVSSSQALLFSLAFFSLAALSAGVEFIYRLNVIFEGKYEVLESYLKDSIGGISGGLIVLVMQEFQIGGIRETLVAAPYAFFMMALFLLIVGMLYLTAHDMFNESN